MRSRVLAIALLIAVAVAGCTAASSNKAAAALSTPTVVVNTINGTGCPANTATATVLPDGAGIQVAYTSAFTAKAGTGSTPLQFRRNCQLNITLTSTDQRYTVSTANHQGSVTLPVGGVALQRNTYYLQGDSIGTPVDHTANGPLSEAWSVTDTSPFAAPCGTTRNLNINMELRVTSPGPAASLSLDSSTINLIWSAC
jgi:hypothetical protein